MFLVLLLLWCSCWTVSSGNNNGILCIEAERQALLNIKAGFHRYDNGEYFLRSWGTEEEECCEWIGIQCDNRTGHVVHLDLSHSTIGQEYYYLHGQISSSLGQLSYLNYLDLSGVFLYPHPIPSFLGNLRELRYLNLSYTGLSGEMPPQLGNLSRLQFLDLSNIDLSMKSLDWASRLSSLQLLDLGYINMSTCNDWVPVLNNLPSLTTLRLQGCSLPNVTNIPSSLPFVNSSKRLSVLDLSENSLSDSVFQWLFNYSHSLVHLDLFSSLQKGYSIPRAFGSMASLEFLSLPYNGLGGSIPDSFGNITNLKYLDLSTNTFEGSIPESFGNITNLKHLDLSSNTFEGSIPESFGNMTSLEYLNLYDNALNGGIPASIWEICTLQSLKVNANNIIRFSQSSSSKCSHFSLEYLDLSENRIAGPIPNFTFYPSLIELKLSSNEFHGDMSKSIGQLSVLTVLDISKNSLNGVMSEAHLSKLFSLKHLDLSSNPSLVLNISFHWVPPFQLEFVYLGSCKLGPRFPKWLQTQKSLIELDISNSSISGSVPDWFWNSFTQYHFVNLSNNQISGAIKNYPSLERNNFTYIDLSSNQFEGPIPLFLFRAQGLQLSNNKFSSLSFSCNATIPSDLFLVDISFNELVGELPDCWLQFQGLRILVLTNNKLSGEIPSSIGSLPNLVMLHLGSNNLSGKLPFSLRKCWYLEVLDVGENRLVGPIPEWIRALPFLFILNLRSNHFNGSFPSSLCRLVYIQILDLSSNHISGTFPNCIGRLMAMKKIATPSSDVILCHGSSNFKFCVQVAIRWKGKLSWYKNTLGLVKSFDVSNNNLVGEIPKEIALLDGLVSLNLSTNSLTGQIPTEIGNLKSLDVLDLSKNHLSGTIPSSLSGLSFMNTFDVSNNNLSGKIPTSTQLQSFDPSRFAGNSQLCGAPLPKKCPEEEANTSTEDEDEDNLVLTRGFYVCMGLGFVVGFWGICGSLLYIESWRIAYFGFLNGVGDRVYVMIQLHKAKLLRMIKC